eukprot:6752308-Lingulodinium_polyedra.AAC.1
MRSATALRQAKAALKGWRRLAPEFEHDPMPWEAAVAICVWLAPLGRPWLHSARALVVQFDSSSQRRAP